MKRLVLFILVALYAMVCCSVFAEEKEGLTLSIGGKLMERDMPQDIEEAQKLIRYLVEIANNADKQIETNYYKNLNEIESYKRQNELLEMKLENLESKLREVYKASSDVSFDINAILKQNTRCAFLFGVGPTVGSDLSIGLHLNALGIYRLFYNVQIGAEIFSNIYQNTDRNGEFGIGLVFGYSIY